MALACSTPPTGRRRWTLRLLADRFVELRQIDLISPDTVGRVLKKTTSNPGKNDNFHVSSSLHRFGISQPDWFGHGIVRSDRRAVVDREHETLRFLARNQPQQHSDMLEAPSAPADQGRLFGRQCESHGRSSSLESSIRINGYVDRIPASGQSESQLASGQVARRSNGIDLLPRPAPPQDGVHRLQQDQQIEADAGVLQVVQVVLKFLPRTLFGIGVEIANLRPAGETRLA